MKKQASTPPPLVGGQKRSLKDDVDAHVRMKIEAGGCPSAQHEKIE